MIFFCYLQGEPNAKTGYLHSSLMVLSVKCRTCSRLRDIKRRKTLSSVFCLTALFFFPFLPPPNASSFYSLHFCITNVPFCVWKYKMRSKNGTVSTVFQQLRVFNIRLLNYWQKEMFCSDTSFKWQAIQKADEIRRGLFSLGSFYTLFCKLFHRIQLKQWDESNVQI